MICHIKWHIFCGAFIFHTKVWNLVTLCSICMVTYLLRIFLAIQYTDLNVYCHSLCSSNYKHPDILPGSWPKFDSNEYPPVLLSLAAFHNSIIFFSQWMKSLANIIGWMTGTIGRSCWCCLEPWILTNSNLISLMYFISDLRC